MKSLSIMSENQFKIKLSSRYLPDVLSTYVTSERKFAVALMGLLLPSFRSK